MAQDDPQTSQPEARCPRCDYELDGMVAAFTEQCPLRGRCSECGLEFEWSNILRADRRQLPWLFEHCRAGPMALLRALILTALRTLLPKSFWNRVKLWHDVRRGRLWLYVLLSAGGIVLPISIALASCVFLVEVLGPATPRTGRFAGPDYVYSLLVYPFGREYWWSTAWTVRGVGVNWGLLSSLLLPLWAMNISWPLMMLVLSDSRKEVKVHRGHVLRAWAYSMWWAVLLSIVLICVRVVLCASMLCEVLAFTSGQRIMAWVINAGNELLYSSFGAGGMAIAMILTTFIWTARWWWVVIVRYWQFSRPGLVYWLIFVVSLLAVPVCAAIPMLMGWERSW